MSETLIVLAIASLAFFTGCGDSSDGSQDQEGSSLAFQVRWEQAGAPGAPPFDSPIPETVSRVRVIVRSGTYACCVKFDPRDGAFDERRVVLTALPEGLADVDVRGFPTDTVPNEAIAETCVVKQPLGVGSACDATGCGQASFAPSEAISANLRAGRETVARPLAEVARPFVINADPACDRAVSDPSAALFLVVAQVDSGECICEDGVLLCGDNRGPVAFPDPQVFQVGSSEPCSIAPRDAPRQVVESNADVLCCSDTAECAELESCCRPVPTPDGLGDIPPTPHGEPLIGFQIFFDAELEPGCAEVHVPVTGLPGAVGTVVHPFVATTPPPTPSPTQTPTQTPGIVGTPVITVSP